MTSEKLAEAQNYVFSQTQLFSPTQWYSLDELVKDYGNAFAGREMLVRQNGNVTYVLGASAMRILASLEIIPLKTASIDAVSLTLALNNLEVFRYLDGHPELVEKATIGGAELRFVPYSKLHLLQPLLAPVQPQPQLQAENAVSSDAPLIDQKALYTLADLIELTTLPEEEIFEAIESGKLETKPFYAGNFNLQSRITGSSLMRHLESKRQAEEAPEVEEPSEFYNKQPDIPDYVSDDKELRETEREALGNVAAQFYKYARRVPLLTLEEEVRLGRIIKARAPGWEEALHWDVEANYRLVLKVANRHFLTMRNNAAMDKMDLVQEGVLGLRRAWLKYDPDYRKDDDRDGPYRFSTYAYHWIRQAITRTIKEKSNIIRLPVNLYGDLSKIGRARSQLEQELGRGPTVDELAEFTGIQSEKIAMLNNALSVDSLNKAIDDDGTGELTLEDVIADDSVKALEEMGEDSVLSEKISWLLDKYLTGINAQVMRRRFGINQLRKETLEEIGRSYGVTRERIRQREEGSLRRLKKAVIRNPDLRSFFSAFL